MRVVEAISISPDVTNPAHPIAVLPSPMERARV
jgi:hypothetical protein